MSWFKRTPKVKEPPKPRPHRRKSALTEQLMQEVKQQHRDTKAPIEKNTALRK